MDERTEDSLYNLWYTETAEIIWNRSPLGGVFSWGDGPTQANKCSDTLIVGEAGRRVLKWLLCINPRLDDDNGGGGDGDGDEGGGGGNRKKGGTWEFRKFCGET